MRLSKMDLSELKQELDRTRRLIDQSHDRVLVRELRAYAAELESRIDRAAAVQQLMSPRPFQR